MNWASMVSVNAFDRALAAKIEGKRRFLLQWEWNGHVGASVVWAKDLTEAQSICDAKSRSDFERDRLLIVREYDPITDGDVSHD